MKVGKKQEIKPIQLVFFHDASNNTTSRMLVTKSISHYSLLATAAINHLPLAPVSLYSLTNGNSLPNIKEYETNTI